ncbi:MAG: type 4a pilus biogenesis protein PilO [Phycisphaerae bacterium]|nr:type 4a pilus biogenesis protein PilO [Phycisphaerae bacterium]
MILIDNLANLSRSTRNTVFTGLIVITTILMYDWIVAPHITYLFAVQEYESVVSNAVKKNKAIIGEVEIQTKKLKELNEQFARSRSVLFTADEAKKFFDNLQAISKEAGCSVNSLNLVAKAPSSGEDALSIVADSAVLSFTGRYNNVTRLVEKLQNYSQKVWIDSFKMEPVKFGSSELKCDMTITIYTIQSKDAAL